VSRPVLHISPATRHDVFWLVNLRPDIFGEIDAGQLATALGQPGLSCWAAREGENGRPQLLAGVNADPLHSPWRGTAFAITGDVRLKDWPEITAFGRALYARLLAGGMTRIETHVRQDFAAGQRWVRHLGFTFEGVMPGFCADGSAAIRYGIAAEAAQAMEAA